MLQWSAARAWPCSMLCALREGVNQGWANTRAVPELAGLALSSEGICGKLLKDFLPLLMN